MFSFENIYKHYIKCRKNKRNSNNALEFETNQIDELMNLEIELNNREYKTGKYICFISSMPKFREIFAPSFRDRIVHHILVNELEKFYERRFIYDVYNNRINKGIHKAIKRAKSFMNRYKNGCYLQLDIKNFFYSIDKNILFKILLKDIKYSNLKNKDNILWLSNKIIYQKPTLNYKYIGSKSLLKHIPPHKSLFGININKGLPIGNLTSQFFANVYMNGFDNFIKRKLKIKSYIRYVDDFVIFAESKQRLYTWYVDIKKYLYTNLSLSLRDDVKLNQNNKGLDFLGYIIRPNYILTRKRVINKYKQKKAQFLDKYEQQLYEGISMDLEEINKFKSIQASYFAHIKHSNSYKLKQKGEIDEEKYIKLIATM